MAEKSNIEWTDATANFWWGCQKVSAGCQHCYADTLANRYGKQIWGSPKTTERERKKAIWNNVKKWDKKAREEGRRIRMFTMSMGDFFEDHPQLVEWRDEAMTLLESLTNIDVQLLTKRPENVPVMAERWMDNWPKHIWIGTSVEDQKSADERIPYLLAVPTKVRFLSMEPLLGAVDITPFVSPLEFDEIMSLDRRDPDAAMARKEIFASVPRPDVKDLYKLDYMPHLLTPQTVDWVIVGGESGHGARPCAIEWIESIVEQCQSAEVPVFVKQLGAFPASIYRKDLEGKFAWRAKLNDRKGGDLSEFPESLRVREFPKPMTS